MLSRRWSGAKKQPVHIHGDTGCHIGMNGITVTIPGTTIIHTTHSIGYTIHLTGLTTVTIIEDTTKVMDTTRSKERTKREGALKNTEIPMITDSARNAEIKNRAMATEKVRSIEQCRQYSI